MFFDLLRGRAYVSHSLDEQAAPEVKAARCYLHSAARGMHACKASHSQPKHVDLFTLHVKL